jgi:hypothetical protein
VTNQLLEIDVRLLVLRYGRQRILKVLARLGDQTLEDLDRQLRTVEQRSNVHRTIKQRQSLSDVVVVASRERPEIAEPLRAIAVNFENRTFLPHLRDVQRFFDRIGAPQQAAKSRAEIGPALIRALSKLKREELVMLAARDGAPRESDYSLLSRAIMGGPATPRDRE